MNCYQNKCQVGTVDGMTFKFSGDDWQAPVREIVSVTRTTRDLYFRVHGFAALDPSSHRLRVYLINKMEHTMRVLLRLPARWSADAKGDVGFSAASMVDTADHWGTRSSLQVACGGGACVAELPGASFTMLVSAAG